MNKLVKFSQIAIALTILFSCEIDIPLPKIDLSKWAASLDAGGGSYDLIGEYYFIGDEDGFGIGLVPGRSYTTSLLSNLPVDFRGINDPTFTDIYPVDIDSTISYTYTFDLVNESIFTAWLNFQTLGIIAGDSTNSHNVMDIKLYIDDTEIIGAFDEVNQVTYIDGEWVPIVGLVNVVIPRELFPLLLDGKAEVYWEIIGEESESNFAIDYCSLYIAYHN